VFDEDFKRRVLSSEMNARADGLSSYDAVGQHSGTSLRPGPDSDFAGPHDLPRTEAEAAGVAP